MHTMRRALQCGCPVETCLIVIDDVPDYENRGWKRLDSFIHSQLGLPAYGFVYVWRTVERQ